MENKEKGFLGQIGNSVLSGSDKFWTKVDDLGSLATGVALLPYEWLEGKEGDVTQYLEENEERKKQLIKNIQDRKSELDRYVNANPVKGSIVKVASNFAEQTVDPLQMGLNMATHGFAMNAIQNTLDYIYEETSLSGRNIKDFGLDDAVNIGVGVAMAGVTSKFEFKGEVKSLYEDIAPLDKIIKANEKENRVIDHQALADIQVRKDSGQTLSLPKKHKIDIEKTINEGVIPRLKQLSDVAETYAINIEKGLDNTEGTVKIKREIDIMTKPIFTEVELGKEQALGEIADDLSKIVLNSGEYDGYTPVRDIVKKSVESIDKETFVKILQGKEVEDQYKPFQNMIRNYANEYISIKSGIDYTGKEKGHFLETLYNKRRTMIELRDAYENLDKGFELVHTKLKDIGDNIVISDEQAITIGLEKGGEYNLKDTPQLLQQLYYDINSTTKDVTKGIRKGTVEFEDNSLFDVAYKWANVKGKKRYSKILKKIENYKVDAKNWEEEFKIEDVLNKRELNFKKKFEEEMLDKFENVFKGNENEPSDVLRNIFSTVVNERSGYNKVLDIFDSFNTACKVGEDATYDIKWLDFTMHKDMIKPFKNRIDSFRTLNSFGDLKPKIFSEMGSDDKLIKSMRDLSSYKLLPGIRHVREATPNGAIINSGSNKLGFDSKYSIIKSNADMMTLHYKLAKNIDKNLNANLNDIADPLERFQTKMFIERILNNRTEFESKGFSSKLEKAGEIAGSGQLLSDVHRTGGAYKLTAHCMLDELPNMKYNELKPELRALLKNNGILETEFTDIQTQLKNFTSFNEFLEYALDGTDNKIHSLFQQMADVMGKEFEAYDKTVTSIKADSFSSKLWTNTNLIFKRYSMGAFNRAINSVSSYYDANDILRSRFSDNGRYIFRNVNFKDTKFHATNLTKLSIGLGLATQATSWIHGKVFGTGADEVVEAKFEALANGDYIPIIADAMVDSITDYIGYDVMFGGRNAPYGIVDGTYKGLQRMATSDLTPAEKIIYGTLYTIAPSNVSRGIDNIKFGKNITSKINTWSEEAQFLWKEDYRKRALEEQLDGELPVEKLVKNTFSTITNWQEYFNKNEDKAYEVTNFDRNVDKEVVKMTASGIMEMAEKNIRNDHINYSFSFDDVQEREKALKEFSMDYKSQLKKLDKKTRDLFNYVMAFKQVDDPLYIITALDEMTTSKNKIKTLKSFLNEEDLPMFDNFVDNIIKHEDKKKEIARRGYEDTTEGYIKFLQTLRNEL